MNNRITLPEVIKGAASEENSTFLKNKKTQKECLLATIVLFEH